LFFAAGLFRRLILFGARQRLTGPRPLNGAKRVADQDPAWLLARLEALGLMPLGR
jgi:hypothetical protein